MNFNTFPLKNRYLNDKILVESLKGGQEDAFAYLMDVYYNKLCVYAGSLSNDVYTAQDIVQNVFLKVWEQRNKLKSTYSINSFLYKSVYNEFIDHYRKNKLLTSLEENHIKHLNMIIQEADAIEITRLIELVKKEIENLPSKCKTIFTMGKLEGLTYAEIAEYQKISVRTVENQMSKAFEIIRQKVGNKIDVILFLLFDFSKNSKSYF